MRQTYKLFNSKKNASSIFKKEKKCGSKSITLKFNIFIYEKVRAFECGFLFYVPFS